MVGVTVVEFAGLGPGPYAAMLLADMGASVIRVERPQTARVPPTAISQRGRALRVSADLKDAKDVEAVKRLLSRADILIEGMRPGAMERLALGPDDVRRVNPRLVYGRVTGWGQTGPLSKTAGHDINYIAITGALAAIGPRERPVPPLNLVGDFAAGSLFMVNGVLAAVLAARRTGQGQTVDAAMYEGTLSLLSAIHEKTAEGHWVDEREANVFDGGAPFYGVYECQDGRHLSVGPLEWPFYQLLCDRIGLDPLPVAERDDVNLWAAQRESLARVFRSRPRDAWVELLGTGDHCVAPVLRFSEVPENAHVKARRALQCIDGVVQSSPVPRFSNDECVARPGERDVISISEFFSGE